MRDDTTVAPSQCGSWKHKTRRREVWNSLCHLFHSSLKKLPADCYMPNIASWQHQSQPKPMQNSSTWSTGEAKHYPSRSCREDSKGTHTRFSCKNFHAIFVGKISLGMLALPGWILWFTFMVDNESEYPKQLKRIWHQEWPVGWTGVTWDIILRCWGVPISR